MIPCCSQVSDNFSTLVPVFLGILKKVQISLEKKMKWRTLKSRNLKLYFYIVKIAKSSTYKAVYDLYLK